MQLSNFINTFKRKILDRFDESRNPSKEFAAKEYINLMFPNGETSDNIVARTANLNEVISYLNDKSDVQVKEFYNLVTLLKLGGESKSFGEKVEVHEGLIYKNQSFIDDIIDEINHKGALVTQDERDAPIRTPNKLNEKSVYRDPRYDSVIMVRYNGNEYPLGSLNINENDLGKKINDEISVKRAYEGLWWSEKHYHHPSGIDIVIQEELVKNKPDFEAFKKIYENIKKENPDGIVREAALKTALLDYEEKVLIPKIQEQEVRNLAENIQTLESDIASRENSLKQAEEAYNQKAASLEERLKELEEKERALNSREASLDIKERELSEKDYIKQTEIEYEDTPIDKSNMRISDTSPKQRSIVDISDNR